MAQISSAAAENLGKHDYQCGRYCFTPRSGRKFQISGSSVPRTHEQNPSNPRPDISLDCPAFFAPVEKRHWNKESVWDEERNTSQSR